jgi:hypothetical protein
VSGKLHRWREPLKEETKSSPKSKKNMELKTRRFRSSGIEAPMVWTTTFKFRFPEMSRNGRSMRATRKIFIQERLDDSEPVKPWSISTREVVTMRKSMTFQDVRK